MRVRTGYSFRTAAGHLPEVMARIKDLGWECAPITDRMSTFGFVRWTKLCEKEGLKPIYGVEIPCVTAFGDKKLTADWWTFFAQDDIRALHDLVYKAGTNPNKEPALSYAQALSAKGVFIMSGNQLQLDALNGLDVPDNFFVALGPSTPIGLYRRARRDGRRMVATSDNLYPTAAHKEFYRVAMGRRSNTQTYPLHLLTDDELREWYDEAGIDVESVEAAMANRWRIRDGCSAVLRKARLLVPEKPKTLRELCVEGAARTGTDLANPEYAERLEFELERIHEKQFEDYFFILADMIAYAKERMVVGPARGSSCGSLVCYLLGITAIDPIPYHLIFERFIDTNRKDLPDIDVDFSDAKRHLVFEYAEQKYGRDRVARLGTVGMFQARSALNAAAVALRIPSWRINKLTDSIIVRSSGDSRAQNTLEDTLKETDAGKAFFEEYPECAVAMRLEGHPQVSSQHAAGLLLTDTPIVDYVAMDSRARAAWCDKKDAEYLNLLKIDALGLTQLSIFERTLELIGEKPTSAYLEKLPLDDPKAYEILNKHQFSGIFQLTGVAVRSLAAQIPFETIDDLIALSALARPGPLASGGTMAWIQRRNGAAVPQQAHPMLDELTADTYGVVIYQETVMRICRELGKFSWAEVSDVRQAMSRRLGDEFFAAYWAKFKQGCAENGVAEDIAKKVWDQINSFGSWAFNKSHAVAYGIVSYWCAYLKAHFPLEYAAACLDAEPLPDKQLNILRELAEEGVGYTPVDPEHSAERWTIATDDDGKKRLVGPLSNIKGIGPALTIDILEARKTGAPLKPGVVKKLTNATTEIDSLYPIADRIRELHPDLAAINIFSTPTRIADVKPGIRGDILILARVRAINPRDENEAINVQKRGGRIITGPDKSLNLFFMDDSDEIFCKIDRFKYAEWRDSAQTKRFGHWFLETAKTGKSLFAILGTCPPDFRMIKVKNMRYLGEMSDAKLPEGQRAYYSKVKAGEQG